MKESSLMLLVMIWDWPMLTVGLPPEPEWHCRPCCLDLWVSFWWEHRGCHI